jgi:hypothetical protein
VSMLRLPCGVVTCVTRTPINALRYGEVRERGANTDYKILMALPPSQLGFSDKRPASRAVPISGIGGVLPPDPYGTHEMGPKGSLSISSISPHWLLACCG